MGTVTDDLGIELDLIEFYDVYVLIDGEWKLSVPCVHESGLFDVDAHLHLRGFQTNIEAWEGYRLGEFGA